MNKFVQQLGHIIGEIPVIGKIKPWALKYINPWTLKQRNKRFLTRGLDVLDEFDKIMTSNDFSYSLIFGTLLGAVREKGFIKHDFDIDVAIWHTIDNIKVSHILEAKGFKLLRRMETDNGEFGREETYIKDGVYIDLFYFYPYNQHEAYTTVLVPFPGTDSMNDSIKQNGGVMPIQLILPFSLETERISFHSLMLPAIKNRIEFLEARYGKNWRIPDPTFVYPKMGDVKCKYRNDKIAKISY